MRTAGVQRCRGTERRFWGLGVAGGGFSLGRCLSFGTNLSPIKQVAFRPHELMLGASWALAEAGSCLLPTCGGSLHSKTVSPLAFGPARALWTKKDRRGLGLAFRRHSSSPRGSWSASDSGPPARLSGQGRQMSLPTWEAAKRAGRERLACWPGPRPPSSLSHSLAKSTSVFLLA